jgi:uncharacterized protein
MSAERTPTASQGQTGTGKHMPVRTCVVCRAKAAKRGYTRLVRTENGITIDPSGKMNGRGAYVCDQEACWQKAATTDLVAKALRVSMNEDDRARLIEYHRRTTQR